MKRVYISSLSLPKGFPINEYETRDEIIKDGADQVVDYNGMKCTRDVVVINNYLHQKDGLVQGRADLALWLEVVAKFPWLTKQVTKKIDGKDVAVTEYLETEGKYIERFVTAATDGTVKVVGLTLTGTNAEQNEAVVWAFLQSVVDKPTKITVTEGGKPTEVTLFDLKNDIKAPVHVAKAKTPPQYALEAAGNIIKNGTQSKWATTFKKEGVDFEDFSVADDVAGNTTRLAWAIQAREQAKARKEYA